ncbi:ribose 5-phosphate isomerase B [Thermotoga sp. SG1]|uniref:ribose 5-phosphate isomerase B n=1 Tax=Thermotoga sp. SG1 TaxID=126739 RepID=UPI000C77ED32|nr:ribose 5-phosphate isomerase B [Thermotoga sp. SG1]PLV56120.1 ribose-5-phosphate isomerase [Thermotoga sp. SG1]
MKIAIASDHAAFELKEKVKNYLLNKGIEVLDHGTHSEESVDYPDYAKKVVQSVLSNEVDYGILLCGTGLGMSIAANRYRGIRAALCLFPDMARLARSHNNANVLVLPGRLIGSELAFWIVDTFLSTPFDGGRHERRIRKIDEI